MRTEGELTITLEVAGKDYRVPIRRGEKQEEEEYLYRQAAKRVQLCLMQYRQYFSKSLENTDMLAMVAIHLARDVEQLKMETDKDSARCAQKIQQWTDSLNTCLDKTG